MSYKVFLTKSAEAARAIANGFEINDDIKSISSGSVSGEDLIPDYYKKHGFFCCIVGRETKAGSPDTYELVVC